MILKNRSLRLLAIVGTITTAGMLSACSGLTTSGAPTGGGQDGPPTVAMLLPENVNPRWESQDATFFEEQLKKLVPDATVEVYNANNDASKQQQQAEQALTKGADVLVVIPVDAAASGVIADSAASSGIPTVAYDRMIDSENVAAWIQADMVAVGEAQAQWLVDHTEDGDNLIQIKGSPTDTNARLFDEGYQNVLSPLYDSGERVKAYDTWTQGWDPAIARTSVDQALTRLNNNVQGILASSDGNAAAAIASLEEQNMAGEVPVTGLDGTVQALQLMLQGKQGMTVWRPFDQMGEKTAEVVQRLLEGKDIDDIVTGTVTNGVDAEVPQIQTEFYVATDEEGIQYIIDKDPSIEMSDVCTGATASLPFCAGS
ncbi:sugar ABC transporter substrate-binding protein [Leucobacter sp. UCD-THU]|uniref:ABC transporter substrate-binding protein n=1 Tax=Leucobacter sp. UCD-THU TaxID=1292023 RepID=UPI001930AD15|nr:sugar ABC transporter substrate-binding protein [Leucobacter sp. UCD-THU]